MELVMILGEIKLKRYLLLLLSLFLISGLIVGCSSGDTDASSSSEETSETSEGNDLDAKSLGIELRSHDFDEAEEVIDDSSEEENYYLKSGTNLTLPDEFPSDFPIPEGMSVDSVLVKQTESGTVQLELWFNDGGNYTIDQLYALYEHYTQNSGFEDSAVNDLGSYLPGLMSYEGIRDNLEYVIGVNPEKEYNVVTLSTYVVN